MVWCVWTAVLAAMPYGVYSFGPLIPGQVSIAAFGLAVMLFVVIALLASCLGQGWQGIVARARVIVVRVGWVATAGLAAAEVYALVRGNAGLDTIEQIAFNDVMSLVEFVCDCGGVLLGAFVRGAGLHAGKSLTRSADWLVRRWGSLADGMRPCCDRTGL